MYPFRLSTVSTKGYAGKRNSLSMYPSEAKFLATCPCSKKDDDFNFKRVLQRFLALAMYPIALKEYNKNQCSY